MANVLIPLAQGCEELEAVTIIDLLRRAEVNVVTAGLDEQAVTASRKTVLIPDTTLDAVDPDGFDMIVLPGGLPGADHLNEDVRIHRFLQQMNRDEKYIAAICAAPKVLATAGLLNHKSATSYPGSLDGIAVDEMQYLEESVVVDGRVITSRGPGTAMDFALCLIEILQGVDKRNLIEKQLMRG